MTDLGKTLVGYLEFRQSFERMVILNDERIGLEVTVVIHDTTLGPGPAAPRGMPSLPGLKLLLITCDWPEM